MTRRAPLLAAAVALLVYLPSLAGGFLYDDLHVVVENRGIRDLRALDTILRYEPSRPLLNLTWAINYALNGLTPWPYHLVNVVIHAGNAALLASLFLWMAIRARLAFPERAALIGACFFAATPMAAETVAYVSSRSTALASFFVLASLRLAVMALDGTRRRAGLALGLACLILGLVTKEEAASIPLFLLVLDYFFVAGGKVADTLKRWRLHLPFLLLPLIGLVARRIVSGTWLPAGPLGRGHYLLTQWAAFPLYFLRALVPLDPALYRNVPPANWPPAASTWVFGFITTLLAAGALLGRRRWPLFSFAVLWLALGLLPSSSLVPLNEMLVDHRAYLGGAGIAFCVGSLISAPEWRPSAAALLVLLGARSLHYEWVLADPVRAWQDAAGRAPRSATAQRSLGDAYSARGDPRAESAFRQAIALDPGNGKNWTNLAVFLAQGGRLGEAEASLREAARVAPLDGRMRDNLGTVLVGLGREEEARAEFESAMAGDPLLAAPRINLAHLLYRRGERDAALGLLNEAAKLEVDLEDGDRLFRLRERILSERAQAAP